MIEQLFMGQQNGLPSGGKHYNGFTWIVDTNTAREACLVLGSEEVLGQGGKGSTKAPAKPILTSSCPGWVCYAEKTHPYVLPYISKVKSPQALMGTLVKTTLSRILNISPDRIWHLAVMPCFDKKLEASREELTDAVWKEGSDGKPGKGIRDVDCVITSKEILMLAASRGIDFFNLPKEAAVPQPPFPNQAIHKFLFPPKRNSRKPQQTAGAGTSGGNLHYILHDVRSKHPASQIQTTRGRNADVIEYAVITAAGETVFKAARYYGFRNIQNLVRKLKPAKASRMTGAARRPTGKSAGLDFAYVEVMACPGGCTNGGGQIKVDDPVVVDRKGLGEKAGPEEQKAWLAEVDEAYFSADEPDSRQDAEVNAEGLVAGVSPSHIHDTLESWSDITSIDLDRLAYTSYREVVSDVGKQITDTERVIQLASKIGGGW
ncbi:cytosolic Fe-S cluster assembly factor NAR1 [Podospora australis]|uniref:Nuclear architecture-related protein 1 n=1 Tax=Podospora australis TaxID=1536484 RepID=A0AAN6X3B2_9PEZI|nr:cytosolic Fe-S cluster assembly factor NAR1 [Podospora australis]